MWESQPREKGNSVPPQQTTTQHRRYQATSCSTWTKENSTTKKPQAYYRNPYEWMTADAAAPWRSTSLPGMTHTLTGDLSHRDKHFQTTAVCLHSVLILSPQKRWGQHMINVDNSVLIPHAGGEKPHQRVFMELLQGNSINLLIKHFWLGSGKGNPDAASLNLKQTCHVLKIKQKKVRWEEM